MKKDLQKPILYKADPYVFSQIEVLKEQRPGLNRNKMINEAMTLYIMLIKKIGSIECMNEITFNQADLQKFLFKRCKEVQYLYGRIY